jgi:hypothetical protein
VNIFLSIWYFGFLVSLIIGKFVLTNEDDNMINVDEFLIWLVFSMFSWIFIFSLFVGKKLKEHNSEDDDKT